MVQAAKELLLFQRIQPDQHHHAIAEEYRDAICIDAKRERCRGKDIATLEARRIQALTDKKGAGRGAVSVRRRFGGLVHELCIPTEIAI